VASGFLGALLGPQRRARFLAGHLTDVLVVAVLAVLVVAVSRPAVVDGRIDLSDATAVLTLVAAAVGSRGRGLSRPPSTSTRPSTTAGVNRPGIAKEARIAGMRGPRWNHTSRRAARSVATAVKGIGSDSMSTSPTMSSRAAISFSAVAAPPPAQVGSASRTTRRPVRVEAQAANSVSLPAATRPPMTAPIDVPETATISWPRSRSSWTAPRWA